MLREGAGAAGDAVLLSLLLGGGGDRSARRVAETLLSRFGGLGRLVRAAPQALLGQPGVGPARAIRLLAAFELAARARNSAAVAGAAIRSPRDVVPLVASTLHGRDREHFVVVYLDTRHRVTGVETVAVGCLNASLVHPREVFKGAVLRSAAAVIVAHNHPSGDPSPSGEDRSLTARLAACGRLLGIDLLDHIVYGDGDWVSLRENGWPQEAAP